MWALLRRARQGMPPTSPLSTIGSGTSTRRCILAGGGTTAPCSTRRDARSRDRPMTALSMRLRLSPHAPPRKGSSRKAFGLVHPIRMGPSVTTACRETIPRMSATILSGRPKVPWVFVTWLLKVEIHSPGFGLVRGMQKPERHRNPARPPASRLLASWRERLSVPPRRYRPKLIEIVVLTGDWRWPVRIRHAIS